MSNVVWQLTDPTPKTKDLMRIPRNKAEIPSCATMLRPTYKMDVDGCVCRCIEALTIFSADFSGDLLASQAVAVSAEGGGKIVSPDFILVLTTSNGAVRTAQPTPEVTPHNAVPNVDNLSDCCNP